MKHFYIFLLYFFYQLHPVFPQIINKIPLSERITGYKMDVELDTESKTISGSMVAFWVNKSPDIVPEVRMHMYMNAFRSNRTTFSNRSGVRDAGVSPGEDDQDLGWIEIKSLKDNDGTDLMSAMEYISPDDGNPDDMTVLKISLPEPIKQNDTVLLNVDFETKLPSRIIRTGYSGDFFFVAQWFPKFGVYEPAGMRYADTGGWNCHQFHPHSEFYSDHSLYEVTITLPVDYVTGSGGLLMSEIENGNIKTLVYRAEDIVDFAWTAWPGFAVVNDKWNHVDITLLIPKERIKQVDRQMTAVKRALEYLDENVGPYPWPYLTFVDPPSKGSGAGGMEYTTIFTSASSYFMPSFFHMPEMVTVHEFGHAYFMGILASNEFEEPWLDEGVNSYWEERIMDHYWGEHSGLFDHRLLKIPDITYSRLSYVLSSSRQAATNKEYSWNYPHETYSMMSYLKAATILHTLTGIVGEETMNDIFREYYRKWAFKHPSGQDFIDVVNYVVKLNHGDKFGPDMNWFFDQTLYGSGICDYRVSGIQNTRHNEPKGKISGKDISMSESTEKDSIYTSIAKIERIGDITLPVEILIRFNNGNEILEHWDGKERYKDFTYTGPKKIEWVKIDPEFKIRMDVNYINNSMTTASNKTPQHRFVNKLLTFIELYLSLIYL
jgi:hypothetical protein